MLTIYPQTSSADVKKYFEVADYYSEGQETVGQWGGLLAERLGQWGMVTKAAFDQLCDNINPLTGQPLTLRTNDNRRVGYDFVFSGPKSYSILVAMATEAERQALRAKFDEAANETMAEAEGDMQVRVRKGGAFHDRPTGNMIWAAFDHSTSRPLSASELAAWRAANDNLPMDGAANDNVPPDMQEHKHVFVFNATYDPVEKKIKAGEFSYIKRDGEYYAAVFYSRLASKLEAMGYAIDRRGGKEWEIAGVPQSAIDTFSKRTDEIEKKARELGITDAARKAGLGASTRAKKQKELTLPQLRAAWDAQLSDGERDALARVYAGEIASGLAVTAAEAMKYAIAHCSEQQSVIAERELKRVALLFGLGQVTPEMIDRELASSRYGLLGDVIDGRRMVTTEALQAEEEYIAGRSAGGRGVVPVGVPEGLARTLADGKRLNDGQWSVVTGLLESSNRFNLLEGPAGAGKSLTLQKYDEGMKRAGRHVTYLGTTTDAVEVLAKDGFKVNTLARFLVDEKLQHAARGGDIVCDEVSQLGHKDAVRFYRLAEKLGVRSVTFVGDAMQHGSVPRGAFIRVLKDYGHVQPFRLTEIMRQETPEFRAVATQLSRGETLAGFDAIDGMGWIKDMADAGERTQAIADDYLQAEASGKSVLVIAPTHAEGAAITAAIRSKLRGLGKLGEEEHEFTRLANSNASEAQRGQATTYRAGDVIQFNQNAKGFRKGERLTITDPAMVPLALAGKFSHYRPEAVRLAAGDKIRFTGTVKTQGGQHKLANGATHTVAEITEGGNATGIRRGAKPPTPLCVGLAPDSPAPLAVVAQSRCRRT